MGRPGASWLVDSLVLQFRHLSRLIFTPTDVDQTVLPGTIQNSLAATNSHDNQADHRLPPRMPVPTRSCWVSHAPQGSHSALRHQGLIGIIAKGRGGLRCRQANDACQQDQQPAPRWEVRQVSREKREEEGPPPTCHSPTFKNAAFTRQKSKHAAFEPSQQRQTHQWAKSTGSSQRDWMPASTSSEPAGGAGGGCGLAVSGGDAGGTGLCRLPVERAVCRNGRLSDAGVRAG